MAYWLMKSEPDVYPWEKLVADGTGGWDGVRNHLAARHLRAMQVGDDAFFYHSNIGRAIVGIMRVVRTAYPDPTDATGKFVMVDVAPVQALARPLSLEEIKADKMLSAMVFVKQPRLSVSPVHPHEWARILQLTKK
ncbi:MAG: EVE domain-containing protein [Alphaproteobacteria bacterium]|nr:EVE domain-containing protein [Alphaproteobacteria bacterium]NDC56656.1 EVE domain-containing protein [Alphaproteobacteria bacterium]